MLTSTYSAKNRKGDFTGSWTVEVVRDGRRSILPSIATPKIGKPGKSAYTLGHLEADAGARLKGKKDKKQSLKRFTIMVDLLG